MQSMDNNLLLGALMPGGHGAGGTPLSAAGQASTGMPGTLLMLPVPPGQVSENAQEDFFSLLVAEGGGGLDETAEPAVSPLFAAIQQEFAQTDAAYAGRVRSDESGGNPLPHTAAALPQDSAIHLASTVNQHESHVIERNRVISMQARPAETAGLRLREAQPGSLIFSRPIAESELVTPLGEAGAELDAPLEAVRLASSLGRDADVRAPEHSVLNRPVPQGLVVRSSGDAAATTGGVSTQRPQPMTFDNVVLPADEVPMPPPNVTPVPDAAAAQVAASVAAPGRTSFSMGIKSAEPPPEQELIEVTDGVDYSSEFRHIIGGTDRPQAATVVSGLGRAVGSPQWAEALAGRVQYLVGQNMQRAEIRLDPPELGALEVRINLSEGNTQIQFGAENAAAREALENALPRLRELMSQSGFSEVQVDVGDRHSQQQMAGESSGDSDGSRERAEGQSGDAALSAAEPNPGGQRLSMGGDRVFDAYA